MKTYTITHGSFVIDIGGGKSETKQAGEKIALPDDVAALHATQLRLDDPQPAPGAPESSHGDHDQE
jgi:hypothetical protein